MWCRGKRALGGPTVGGARTSGAHEAAGEGGERSSLAPGLGSLHGGSVVGEVTCQHVEIYTRE